MIKFDMILLNKGYVDFKTMNSIAYKEAELYPYKKYITEYKINALIAKMIILEL